MPGGLVIVGGDTSDEVWKSLSENPANTLDGSWIAIGSRYGSSTVDKVQSSPAARAVSTSTAPPPCDTTPASAVSGCTRGYCPLLLLLTSKVLLAQRHLGLGNPIIVGPEQFRFISQAVTVKPAGQRPVYREGYAGVVVGGVASTTTASRPSREKAMCGRYVSVADRADLIELYNATAAEPSVAPPSYNVAPTQEITAVVERTDKDAEGEVHRQLRTLYWGLVSSWTNDIKTGARMINARVNTLTEKPALKRAFARRRTVIPASGYYEWEPVEVDLDGRVRKQPYYIHPADGGLLSFAGLYELWPDPDKDNDDATGRHDGGAPPPPRRPAPPARSTTAPRSCCPASASTPGSTRAAPDQTRCTSCSVASTSTRSQCDGCRAR
jgi:putative SOS response-associated peptidase YedK